VLAWIISRDPKVVEDFAPDGKTPSAKWDEIERAAAAREVVDSGAKNVQPQRKAAFAAMVYAGESGKLSASGCPWLDGKEYTRCQIEANQWGAGAHLWDWVLRTKQQVNRFDVVYVEEWVRVWFDRASVLRLWPGPDAAPVASAAIPEQQQTMAHSGPLAGKKKTWKSKPSANLTKSEAAVLDAVNELWPDGKIDHKARARDRTIRDWLADKEQSTVSVRVIQRTLKKIHFA
jgi:hypothetical protein